MDSNRSRAATHARYAALKNTFDAVLLAYKETRDLHPLAAMNIDSDAMRSKTLSPKTIDFRVDVERAIQDALQTCPELEAAFVTILEDGAIDIRIAHKVEMLVGAAFAVRGLEPHKYFAPSIRRGRASGAGAV